MNVSRRLPDGTVDHKEVLNKSQIYVTTAGFKNTFAYDKLIQLLVWQIVQPGLSFTMGGSWRVPVKMGLLDRGFVNDLKADGTFDEVSFEREYESRWAGSSLGAFYNAEQFDKLRTLSQPEYEFSGRGNGKQYYVFGIDVARSKEGCQSVVCVFKVNPSTGGGASNKSLVNIYTINTQEESGHFGKQALFIKRLYYKYMPKAIAIDGNGLGHGLVDFMTISNQDHTTGEDFPAFGVINDDDGEFRKLQKSEPRVEKDVLYIIKANGEINDICHTNVLAQMGSAKIKFLADERTAKAKLLGTKVGQAMEPKERADFLRPFTLTSILKTEMMNLIEKREGKNLFLERNNKGIPKDKFSAFEYGLYYIKITEDEGRKKRKTSAKDMMFFSRGGR